MGLVKQFSARIRIKTVWIFLSVSLILLSVVISDKNEERATKSRSSPDEAFWKNIPLEQGLKLEHSIRTRIKIRTFH
jgi:hypothetical protein